ncbi:glycosyltransferase family 4 protein [Thioalkalicoccus limnaeus]|uniref:Glycosyltransferase family 4 protein n=1 Tax=Thioalkalicoccus limnaeus TaxID=120681 RepID=A0ABV4BGU8_9GAMM
MKPRIAFFLTVDWYFCQHYLDLACAARDAGYDVFVITKVEDQGERIRAAGLTLVPLSICRRGLNPGRELLTVHRLARLLRATRPDLLHNIAQKPVLYGSLAARLSGVRTVVNSLPGMGYLFTARHWRARLARQLVSIGYRRLLLRPGSCVTVQNPDDREQLRQVAGIESRLIPGSGVDLNRFRPTPTRPAPPVTIVLAARLLWDKGLGEFVAAARLLRDQGVTARFVLVGRPDPGNPGTVDVSQLQAWQASGLIEWWGYRNDMPAVFDQAHIACLPSYYREGLPKFLIEAAASGLPLVTTDGPGCREVVEPGRNGLLVPARDPEALASALAKLVADPALRARFGQRSRELAERRFASHHILASTLAIYRDLLQTGQCTAEP